MKKIKTIGLFVLVMILYSAMLFMCFIEPHIEKPKPMGHAIVTMAP